MDKVVVETATLSGPQTTTPTAIASNSPPLPPSPLFDFVNDDYGGVGRQTPEVTSDDASEQEEEVARTTKKMQTRRSIADNANRAARILSPIVRKQKKKRGADYDETWTLEADQMEDSDPEVYLNNVAKLAEKRAAQLNRGATERGIRATKRAKGKGKARNANYSSSDSDAAPPATQVKRLPSKTSLQLVPTFRATTNSSTALPVNPKVGRLAALELARISQLDPDDRDYYERPHARKIKLVDPKKHSTGRFLGRIEDTAFADLAPRKALPKEDGKPLTSVLKTVHVEKIREDDRVRSAKKQKLTTVTKGRGGAYDRSVLALDLGPIGEVLGLAYVYCSSGR